MLESFYGSGGVEGGMKKEEMEKVKGKGKAKGKKKGMQPRICRGGGGGV